MNKYWTLWEKKLRNVSENPRLLIGWLVQGMGIGTHIKFIDIDNIDSEVKKKLDINLERLANHEPISKILESKCFYGRDFFVSHDTLDPRSDSEVLIKTVLRLNKSDPLKFIDLGTGTGCLSITLLKEKSFWTATAVDICPHALAVAKHNARSFGVEQRLNLVQSNWWDRIPYQPFDLIISNPPYIKETIGLEKSVALYDPSVALYAGKDGLLCYRIILEKITYYMHSETLFIIEIGYDQQQELELLCNKKGLSITHGVRDIQGHTRVLCARLS